MSAEIKNFIEKGESETVEFKESTGQLSRAVETLCAFANHKGGTIIFGVSNKGKVVGQSVSESTIRHISNEIARLISPPIYPSITEEKTDDKSLIVVTLPECASKPYVLDGRPYKRIGTTNRVMSQQEYERLLLDKNRHRLHWDEELNEIPISEIDAAQLRTFIRTAKVERNLKISAKLPAAQILTALEMLREDKLTNGAIALFGRKTRHHFRQLEVRAARFRGTTKSEFVDNKIFSGNLFEIYDQIQGFFSVHVKIAGKFKEGSWSRKDIPEYPFLALREAVINMLIHRDYYNTSGGMEVAVYDDRMELWNIGDLPSQFSAETLYKPHFSVLRNPLLANAFFLRGDIEQWGRGTLEIVEIFKNAGLPKPRFRTTCGGLQVCFRNGQKIEKEKVSLKSEAKLNKTQGKILDYLKKHGEAGTAELVKLLGISRTAIKKNLKKLFALVEWTGKSENDPTGHYILKR